MARYEKTRLSKTFLTKLVVKNCSRNKLAEIDCLKNFIASATCSNASVTFRMEFWKYND